MAANEHHELLKKRDWPDVVNVMNATTDVKMVRRKYKERDEHGRLPHHWMAAKAQTHTHALAYVGVQSICLNLQALTTRDNKGETPIDIALRSRACAEIIGLLSLTTEEARSLGGKEMLRLYAPVVYWRNEMNGWNQSRSYADCHKWINEHDDELVREVLKYNNSELLRCIACHSHKYSDSLVFLALRMIHRHPLSLKGTNTQLGLNAIQVAEHPQFNACSEIRNVLRLTPEDISSTPFPTLLRQHLPKQFVDEEVFGTYNTACQFIKHMKYDKAELVKVDTELELVDVEADGEAELLVLHKGMLLLNRCIQEPGAGDGPTSAVLDFLRNKEVPQPYGIKKALIEIA